MPDNKETQRVKRWKKGEPLTASRLNKTVDSVNRLNQTIKVNQRRQGKGRQSQVIRLEIKSIQGDFLWCSEPGSTAQIKVAKPYLLQRTPHDGQSRAGISYTYSADTERTANNGSDTETQVVVPSYVAGDHIFAISTITNYSGVTDTGSVIEYTDLNTDARAWAKKAE